MSHDLRITQNFLQSKALVDKIVKLAKLPLGSTVLEIGPGDGIITRRLADAVTAQGKVIAIELDQRLASKLTETFRAVPQVEIVHQDVLTFDLAPLEGEYIVFSNIPFNITSPLLEWLFEPTSAPLQAHLILQEDTLIAVNKQGYSTSTLKSLMIQPFHTIEIAHRFARADFFPQPGVDTALFAFSRRSQPLIDVLHYPLYKDFLAFVSKDRVGEGVWTKLFSKDQLLKLADQSELVYARGIKSQSIEAIISVFNLFLHGQKAKHNVVKGAMLNLRDEQKRTGEINRVGGHHRSKASPPRRKPR